MSDPTPTLVEFLNARITEDEACVQSGLFPPDWDVRWDDDWNVAVAVGNDRWRAECAAKRAIVERATACLAEQWHTGYTCGAENGYLEILDLLAAPFVDHPDFPGGVR